MRYCRFQHADGPQYGLIESVGGRDMITRVFAHRTAGSGLPDEDAPTSKIQPIALEGIRLFAPVQPSKIVCVGRNYLDHVKEMESDLPVEPLIFLKPPSSVISPGDPIVRPKISERVDHEAELAVIISQPCRNLPEGEDVKAYIHGYTCLNDVSARDFQKKDGQWARAKGYDTFCPIGPIITDEVDPWTGISIECKVNGELKQQGNTTQFIFKLDTVLRYISTFMTLLPGDVVSTGTPSGVSPLKAGDVVDVSCGGIGTLSNPVKE